ncbi:tether containing UBX domain for GLUT4 isoform X1 [Pararge aegeria]|uniref:tether containing UBX domain for GLUT4 isoform X1 n=1 Tax=Pararge aegeria TaxID=116150 RepID=UPI0019D171C4|nr:tether containing UBX domain for GLUT4 isoform X1 [Pararge aegeria]XP_039755288.1 tether containing UBX domain for GLUT4 isoform X1 [Pararge aegeria]
MSRDITVLLPNGRRIKVYCTADTNILQLLEDVCAKQGFQPTDYDLKHHNHLLDLTTTVRFCNLPNKAVLEMVEAEKKRVESNVTVGLMLNDGERIMGDFAPNTSLYDLIISLAPNELPSLENPSISYMRQEVTGIPALKEKSLRQLGLIAGRAILRLLDKSSDPVQANVSSVYRCVPAEKTQNVPLPTDHIPCDRFEKPGPSGINNKDTQKPFDPVKLIQKEKEQKQHKTDSAVCDAGYNLERPETDDEKTKKISTYNDSTTMSQPRKHFLTQENLERRLRIEEEVTFVGSQKAIAFTQPDVAEDELSDLPDDFYELTLEEVRKIYHEIQQQRIELENTPMLTSAKRDELEQQVKESSVQKLNTYKNVVVRIQFPDNVILQGVFTPNNTIEDIQKFVKEHLHNQDKPFHIFTTPLKESLDPAMTLIEAKFVPCVHMHFKWLEDSEHPTYLKEEIYTKKTSSNAASILASKYRAPNRRKLEDLPEDSQKSNPTSSTSKQSKVPKWFKK